jgi:hypothetical protein
MQSRNQFIVPPVSLERIMQVFIGEDRKSRLSDCFSVLASSSVHRFDLAFAYDFISILHFFFNKKKIGRICRIFFLAYKILHVFSPDISILCALIYSA